MRANAREVHRYIQPERRRRAHGAQNASVWQITGDAPATRRDSHHAHSLLGSSHGAQLEAAVGSSPTASPTAGTYHVSGPDQCSWFEFATAILCHPLSASVPTPTITAIPSSEYPTPARRPAYSVLDPSRFTHTFGWQLPAWYEQFNACLAAESIDGNQ
jgi:hypothetical protein